MSKINDVLVLYGLVLSGGKSVRMGLPKDQINWYGKEQRYYLADILAHFCDKVYISCRQDQACDVDSNYKSINDVYSDIGPLGGVLSAFQFKPKQAWLVVACDMPFLDVDCLDLLLKSRDVNKIATAFQNPDDNLPEPLVTIWEPKSYPILTDSLALGKTSLRQVLIHNDAFTIKPSRPDILFNVNNPEEMLRATKILRNK